MLARTEILMPYSFTVPEGGKFNIYEININGYKIRVHPPKRSGLEKDHFGADEILIDNVKGYKADVFCVDFQKNTFNRGVEHECDPPTELINEVMQDFLIKAKFVIKGENIILVDLESTS